MSSVRFWGGIASWALPSLVAGVVLLPPHVHPPLMGALAVAVLLVVLGLGAAGRLTSPRAATAAPLIAACGIAALSAGCALQPASAVRQIAAWVCGGFVFMAARAMPVGPEARRVAAAIAIAGTLVALLGLYQSLVAFPSAVEGSGDAAGAAVEDRTSVAVEARLRSGRAVGTLGLPALLASVLIVAIPITAARAIGAAGVARAGWGGAAAAQIAALAATRSLGGAGALLAAALLALPLGWKLRSRFRSILATAAVVAVLAALTAVAVLPRAAGGGEGSLAQSMGQRAANWSAALSMIVTHPALGVGPGGFGVALPAHRTWASNETQHAHNTYLEVVSDLGLGVLPLLLLALATFLRRVERCSRNAKGLSSRSEGWERLGLAVACLAWCAQNLVDFGGYVAASFVPFLAAAGLLSRSASGEAPFAEPEAPEAGLPARSTILAAAVLTAVFAVADGIARGHLEEAVAVAQAREFEEAAASARDASSWNPFDPEAHVVAARALLDAASARAPNDAGRVGLLSEAVAEAEEAVRLDPFTANRRELLAMARSASGNIAGAYAEMVQAARLNPFRASYAADRDALEKILTGGSEGGGATGGSGGAAPR